jgi:hypothetical protein
MLLYLVFTLLFQYGTSSSLNKRQLPPNSLATFNQSVDGRVVLGRPLAAPCYSNYNGTKVTPDRSKCSAVQAGYDNSTFIAGYFGGYQNTNWGMCQTSGQRCVLNFNRPTSTIPTSAECDQGSVPYAYLAPTGVSDVQKALSFAKDSKVPLVVVNSGHDYKGRSSAPNSLALWMHPYQKPITLDNEFTPDGCTSPVGN